jgi:hypothetical protein
LVIRKVGSGRSPVSRRSGKGGDEDHRHVEARQDILDRVDARRAVGQLDVGEHQSGRLVQHRLQRLAARGGDVDDAVAQFLDQRLDVGGDDGLVLDDQDVGGQILVDLLLRLRDQRLGFGKVGVQNLRRLRGREALQRGQQEGLARARRDPQQLVRGVVGSRIERLGVVVLQLRAGGAPDGVEHAIEGHPRTQPGVQGAIPCGERLQRDAHVGVARLRIAGQRPAVAAHVRQMRRHAFQKTHASSRRAASPNRDPPHHAIKSMSGARRPGHHKASGRVTTYENPQARSSRRHANLSELRKSKLD